MAAKQKLGLKFPLSYFEWEEELNSLYCYQYQIHALVEEVGTIEVRGQYEDVVFVNIGISWCNEEDRYSYRFESRGSTRDGRHIILWVLQ